MATLTALKADRSDNSTGETAQGTSLVTLTADVVAAYLSNNTVNPGDIGSVIAEVHEGLARIAGRAAPALMEELKPAVAIKKSITPDYLVCLEDGKKFKSLKRHLRTHYDLSPEQYREKWGLPTDYPMVAPNYATARSNLAKQMGLGQRRRSRS